MSASRACQVITCDAGADDWRYVHAASRKRSVGDLIPLLAASPGGARGQGQSVSLGLISPLGPGASEGFRERGRTMCRVTRLQTLVYVM
ncbi:unnamed protein product [Arctogadus glacialis]